MSANQRGIVVQTLFNWKNKADEGKLSGNKPYDPKSIVIIEEDKYFKSDIKVAQEDRDIINEEG